MCAAILAIAPHPPEFATSVWLGGAGLSVCGLFIVQYISIKAFPIADEGMADLVKDHNGYISTELLASAIASPVIIALWSSILFTIGIVDYVIEISLGGARYKAFALIPLGFGICITCVVLIIGELIGLRLEACVSSFEF
jgi:hypothetical protein